MTTCKHEAPFVVGPPQFGGQMGAQGEYCGFCGISKQEIEDNRLFAIHMKHVQNKEAWHEDCAWCPTKQGQ